MKEITMRMIIGVSALLIATHATAQQVSVPGWSDLERWHARDQTDALARQRVAQRIPIGSSVTAARQGVIDANGKCKPFKKEAGAWKCIINQMTFASRGVDDIRWTIILYSESGKISGISISRYIDTHWTN